MTGAEPRPAASRRRVPWFAIPGVVIMVFLLGYTVAFSHYVADGPAMDPTLSDDDHFWILRQVFAPAPEPGMIVVAESPADGVEVVKRVIAGAGQTVEIRDDEVFVDGTSIRVEESPCPTGTTFDDSQAVCFTERIGEREWQTLQSRMSIPENVPPETVPDGAYYVLGDHRDRSNDSRNPRVGPIPHAHVVGTVVWP